MVNTRRLKAAIVEKGYTQEQVAEYLGISNPTLNSKINNKREFKASEIKLIVELLGLSNQQMMDIFFAERVDFTSTRSDGD